MDLLQTILELGRSLINSIGIPWLDENYGDEWRKFEEQVKAVTEPIHAAMLLALQNEGLLGFVLGDVIPEEGIGRRIWEIRRPYDEKATLALSALGLTPRGNET